MCYLVGGFNPFEKYARQNGNLPNFRGENHQKIFQLPPPRLQSEGDPKMPRYYSLAKRATPSKPQLYRSIHRPGWKSTKSHGLVLLCCSKNWGEECMGKHPCFWGSKNKMQV